MFSMVFSNCYILFFSKNFFLYQKMATNAFTSIILMDLYIKLLLMVQNWWGYFLGRRNTDLSSAYAISLLFPSPRSPMAHQSPGRRAAHKHLLSFVHRGPSPMGRWHWSGNIGTAWLDLANQRCPGSSLHSPRNCSLWENREKRQLFTPQFKKLTAEKQWSHKFHSPAPSPNLTHFKAVTVLIRDRRRSTETETSQVWERIQPRG